MIVGFADSETERFFRDGDCPARWRAISKVVARKLDMLDAAPTLNTLRSPPGNRLEALNGDRAGQFSIRVNDQWRVCFVWAGGQAHDVEITDYHQEVKKMMTEERHPTPKWRFAGRCGGGGQRVAGVVGPAMPAANTAAADFGPDQAAACRSGPA